MKSLRERFDAKWEPEPMTGCWLWTGDHTRKGYGCMTSTAAPRTRTGAHRLAWMFHRGWPIPDGLLVCHRCDVRLCVNPDHLFLGTPLDNTADMIAKGRRVQPVVPRGVDVNTARLTPKSVLALRARWDAGERATVLSMAFGICQTAVKKIGTRKSWAWLRESDMAPMPKATP